MWTPRLRSSRLPAASILTAALGLAVFLLPADLAAQGPVVLEVDTVRAIQPWGRHAEYTFPRLVLPASPAVATAINRHFSTMMLEVDPDTAGDALFDLVWGDSVSGGMPRLNDITWVVRHPLPEVVEIELTAEGCGAYCEAFTVRNIYDLRNGRYLPYDTLFSPEGLKALDDTLYQAWVDRLNGYILARIDDLADKEIDPEFVDQVRGSMELYRQCMDERAVGDPYVEDLSIVAEGMSFSIARCAPHVVLELDELAPVSFTLSLAWCRPFMRPELRLLFP